MADYVIKEAVGHYLVVESMEESSVIKTDMISTLCRVVSVGGAVTVDSFTQGDMILVASNSGEMTLMGSKDIFYIHESHVIAKVDRLPTGH